MNPVSLASVHLGAAHSGTAESATPADVFARVLVKELRSSLPEGGWLGGGPFEVFESLLDEQLAQALAPSLERTLSRELPSLARAPQAAKPAPVLGGAGVVEGWVSSSFGHRDDPIDGVHRHHDGVDIAAPRGTPIRAARAGRVVRAESVGGYGKLVVVDHGGGLETRYAHCEAIDVTVGTHVAAGEVLGRVGDTGRATGPHLHFEVRRDGRAIDPVRAGFLHHQD
ncbi:MAG: M23 family metallopeptidase [Myxococcota bacterium]